MSIDDMIGKFTAMGEGLEEAVMEVVEERAADGVEQIKLQLLNGEDRNGNVTSPGYSTDPWLASHGGWQKWVARKERRGYVVPDNGGVTLAWSGTLLWDYLGWVRDGDSVVFEASGSRIWGSVVQKWGPYCFAPNWDWIGSEIKPKVLRNIVSVVKN